MMGDITKVQQAFDLFANIMKSFEIKDLDNIDMIRANLVSENYQDLHSSDYSNLLDLIDTMSDFFTENA